MSAALHVLSLGAGVQSTTLALMAAHGEFGPMPDLAIFADTGAEPAAVYEHLSWLQSGNVLPFPVEIVTKGNILDDTRANVAGLRKGRTASAPFFAPGKDGRAAPLRRQCTSECKIEPINRRIREHLGADKGERLAPGSRAVIWLGISTDEVYRVKPAFDWWQERRWPLIERRLSRWDCHAWLTRHEYPIPPRSACIVCPYRSNAEWRRMQQEAPAEFAEAIRFDEAIRPGFRDPASGRVRTGSFHLHRSLEPLADIDFASEAAKAGQYDLFGEECEDYAAHNPPTPCQLFSLKYWIVRSISIETAPIGWYDPNGA